MNTFIMIHVFCIRLNFKYKDKYFGRKVQLIDTYYTQNFLFPLKINAFLLDQDLSLFLHPMEKFSQVSLKGFMSPFAQAP